MTGPAAAARDVALLQRLRGLRVQRARAACAAALAEVERALQAVQARQRAIAGHRHALARLVHDSTQGFAPQLPRWGRQVAVRREQLAEALERAEYALLDDERGLERAQEASQRAKAELTRALAREDAVSGLLDDLRRDQRLQADTRAERDAEDQVRHLPAPPPRRRVAA